MNSAERGRSLSLEEAVRQVRLALTCVDADRLEMLERSCRRLRKEVLDIDRRRLEAAGQELHLLKRILDETRSSLLMLKRLHVMQLRERCTRGAGRPMYSNLERAVEYGDN